MRATLLTHALPYSEDSSLLFAHLHQLPWAMMLDSGQPRSQYGRYDIFVAEPFVTLCTTESSDGFFTEICQQGQKAESTEDPFQLLNEILLPFQTQYQALNELKKSAKKFAFHWWCGGLLFL